ncbi:hypothetical protein N431DRAFT_539528 [Stipitochalara longipes BDJ]|nr:hypothetical protein N431DRAFT_539528 [Stipitochalara longipes BDJ]
MTQHENHLNTEDSANFSVLFSKGTIDRTLGNSQQRKSRFATKMSRPYTRLDFAKNAQDIHHWMNFPSSVQINKSKFQTTAMNTRTMINKSRTAANMTRSERRKRLAKRKQQLEHWMQVLESTKHQHSLGKFDSRLGININTAPTTSTQSIKDDNEESLSDVDADLDDLESIHEDSVLATRNGEVDEDIRPTTEEDFANFDVDSSTNLFTGINILELLQRLPSPPLERQTQLDIFSASGTTNILALLQHLPTPPPESQSQQRIPDGCIFTNFTPYYPSASTPIQPSPIDRRAESLSDLDVDLDDLESIPDDFIIPMFNEDGTPAEPDGDSDTVSTTNNNINDLHHSPTLGLLDDSIRDLIIAIQGDDTDIRMEDDFFPKPSNRTPFADITITSPYQNGEEDVIIIPSYWSHFQTRRLQLEEYQNRRREGGATALPPRQHSNHENMHSTNGQERTETEEERRKRLWAVERDEMIFGWNDGQVVTSRGVRRERRQENVNNERLLTPSQDSWTRYTR